MDRLAEFPLCIYCDNSKFWSIDVDDRLEVSFICQKCRNEVVVVYISTVSTGEPNGEGLL